ncbi:leucyl aminopeptidase [Spinactinospora alkalitolerans]|uniref:Probable cytosol aminopeptidase n=1 Tax=Spinactinospora alkalitolerans TaxID=687207 RepID=A0A852U3S2_9ACTN|nr:leucyl aminopeptidase [Spinactinospora alkalitolerans]NYE48764.1 leucyl aminopeptidase [Spinactinospora alkalitolerans]
MSTSLSVITESPSSLDADAVVVGYHSGADGPEPASGAHDVDAAFAGGLGRTLALLGAGGAPEEVRVVPTLGALKAPVVVAVGLDDAPSDGGEIDPDLLSRAAGAALRACEGKARVALALPAGSAGQAGAAAIGALLGAYSFDRYRTGGEEPQRTESLLLVSSADGAAEAAARAEVLAGSVNLARDLVNTSPADLNPEDLAGVAEQVARDTGLEIETLDEHALGDGGYGGIVGVGQGSENPPRLVRLAYSHPEAETTIAFVGKGITFDSGGLSLKPAGSMDWMKSDMGGAAAVLGAMRAIAGLKPVVNVVGYLPIAENMPSGTAQRPSDVLTIYGGKTVEVLNTDAEGRLVMADAIVRAHEDGPDLIVDVATLTGAQLVALGTRVFAVMANDDEVRENVVAAAGLAGEAAWPMPLPEELRKGLDSSVADIANVAGERWGGMLSAGVFLKEFVADGVRWAHLDIAGPAFNQGQPYGYTPKGGTGSATRTLVRIAEANAKN